MTSERHHLLPFLAVSLFLGIPALILILTKEGNWKKSISPTFRKDPHATPPPKPEDILLEQLKRMGPHDRRALTLHVSIGNIYNEAGRFPEAVEQYTAARDIAMTQQRDQLALTQGTLGSAYYHLGKLKTAKRELEAAYIIAEPQSPAAFDIIKTLANVHRDEGKLDHALELYDKLYRDPTLQEAVGSDAWGALNNDLGEAYQRKGEAAKALMYYHQAFDLLQQSSTEAEPISAGPLRRGAELATTHNHIGQTLHEEGKVEKALLQYRMALKIQKESLRNGHPNTAASLMNIGSAFRDLGEPEKAMASLEEAERTLLQAGSKAGRQEALLPEYGVVLALKADLLREGGKLAEAEAAALQALEVQRKAYEGEENPEMAVALNGLGSIYHDQKKYTEAAKLYMHALTISMKTVGYRNPETAAAYNNLGNLYQDVGDDENARKNYEKCLEIQKLTVGEKSPEVSASYNNIGTILYREEKVAPALEYFEKAVNIARASGMPSQHPERQIYEDNLLMAKEAVQTREDSITFLRGLQKEKAGEGALQKGPEDSSLPNQEEMVSFGEFPNDDSMVTEG